MIQEIPTADEFFDSGKGLLGFAWDTAIQLLINLEEAEYFGVDQAEVSVAYWKAAKRRLSTALSITQQGVEFLLKGKIATISPFLLLTDAPQKWPSPYGGTPLKFSDFRTIDAQDLPRVHDTFASSPLSGKFLDRFSKLREKRNTIMHSVDKSLDIEVLEVIDAILYMHKELLPTESWPRTRNEYLLQDSDAELGSGDYLTNALCREMSVAIKLLMPAQVKEYFGVDKKQRRYFCPRCLAEANRDVEFEEKLAVLVPKGASSTTLHCVVCSADYQVVRKSCVNDECPGDVISDSEVCLTLLSAHLGRRFPAIISTDRGWLDVALLRRVQFDQA